MSVLLTAGIGLIVFYRTHLREHVRQLEILDKASKRLAFWDQLLKIELCTTSPDAAARDKFKQEAFQASQKIHADANEAMAILVWEKKLNHKFGFKAFQPEWHKLPGFWKKINWFLYALMAAGFLALACFLWAFLMWVVIQGTPRPLLLRLSPT